MNQKDKEINKLRENLEDKENLHLEKSQINHSFEPQRYSFEKMVIHPLTSKFDLSRIDPPCE